MQALSKLNKGIMVINGLFIAVYLLFFQQIPLIGRMFKAITEGLADEQAVSFEKILLYTIGVLTVLSLLLLVLTVEGPLLKLTLLLFAAYVAHIFIGKVSVAFFSKFFKPWGIPDPWATILLFTTAVVFTITMLQREASSKENLTEEKLSVPTK